MSVINQMLRDLDKQQGKISPAVVPQKPSLPRPPVARFKSGWMLLAVVALAAVVLLTSDRFSFLFGATEVAATTEANNSAANQEVPDKTVLKDGAGKAAVAAAAVVTDTNAKDAVVHEAVVSEQQSSNANQQASTAAAGAQPVVAAPEAVQSASALLPSSAPSSPPSAVTQPVVTEAEVTPTAAMQPGGFADKATLAVTTEATALVTNSSTDNSTNNSDSFPAQKPAEFIAENAEAAEKAPSSMQVETVVFDAKLQLQRLAEQVGEALHQGQWPRLQQQAQQYIQLAPADVQGYEWLAESYRQLQQWQPLQQLLQLCRQQNLQSDLLWLQQGRLASQLKNWPEAEQALQRISPSFAAIEVLQLKANALQQQQKLPEALRAWQQLTTLQPGVGRGWLGKALVLDQQGESQQAKLAYQQALTAGGLSAATVQFIQQRLAIAE